MLLHAQSLCKQTRCLSTPSRESGPFWRVQHVEFTDQIATWHYTHSIHAASGRLRTAQAPQFIVSMAWAHTC